MKTLPYDERIEWLEKHFAQFILDNNWEAIDEYIAECEELVGLPFHDWLVDNCEIEMASDIEAGLNLQVHALEAAADYIDYLVL
jgi:hypothetical protein